MKKIFSQTLCALVSASALFISSCTTSNGPEPGFDQNKTWTKEIVLNQNCVSVPDVNLIFQTTSIPDNPDKTVEFNAKLTLGYNGQESEYSSRKFVLPFNSYSDAAPKGYQLKIPLSQTFPQAGFVSGDKISILIEDFAIVTPDVTFMQAVIVDSSEEAGWYKYLSSTHEFDIYRIGSNSNPGDQTVSPNITDWTLEADFSTTPDKTLWETADWTNGSMFYCGWKPDHVSYADGIMTIRMDDTPFKSGNTTLPYTSGEFRSKKTYGYGYYQVRMKPCRYSGTNSSFFLYTRDDSRGVEWNEIDIEFLGKDTGKVQFNYYIDNKAEGHEYLYTLGFDASTDFHDYGIEYCQDHISWFVDGKKVYTVEQNKTPEKKLPSHPMQIMANFWPGTGVDAWLGQFNYTEPLFACYKSISFKEY